jgi:hypothetical protein
LHCVVADKLVFSCPKIAVEVTIPPSSEKERRETTPGGLSFSHNRSRPYAEALMIRRDVKRRGFRGIGKLQLAILAIASPVLGNGTFDGDQVSLAQFRQWNVGGANPGLNWGLDTLPTAAENITFGTNGDGVVNLGALTQTHPGLSFNPWVTYSLTGGTLNLSTINVQDCVDGTYGSSYFPDGNVITSNFNIASPLTISFTGTTGGVLRISGPLSGAATLTLSSVAAATNRGVYIDVPSPAYTGTVNVGFNTSIRILGPGRPGTGPINLNGGELHILDDAPAGQFIANTVISAVGTIRADHNYTVLPTQPYLPGITHTLVPVIVDNATGVAGVPDAYITFTADNGYNFNTPFMTLSNSAMAPGMPFRVVTVDNGMRYDGYAGSRRVTGPNRLEEEVVTVTSGVPGGVAPGWYDFNFAAGAGFPLSKQGTGVLVIDGDNQVTSTGNKNVFAGVVRFNTPISYGTTTGALGGPAVPVVLAGGGAAAPVSSGMGVGYPTAVPVNLFTTGGIPGQSGAIDIDFIGNPAIVALPAFNPFIGVPTALRIGSSGTGSQVAPVVPYTDPLGNNFYYLGGGGGQLTITAALGAGPGFGANFIEMGTTGNLLPGRVDLAAPVGPFPFAPGGGTLIRAGTLGDLFPGFLAAQPMTSLGAYSTGIDSGCNYIAAPVATPYNGPGMLLLDDISHTAGLYGYGPGGAFGALGLMLEGGAVGWDGPVFVPGLPGVYGAPMASSLYQSVTIPAAPVATNILHFGGEDSAGVMVAGFPITDNFATGTPVALIKSGVNSTLDLTATAVNPYTGGTGIMGGAVIANSPAQLGTGAIVIADGGYLAISPGPPGPLLFPQVLRVANGPQRRSSLISVGTPPPGPVLTARFDGTGSPGLLALEADVVGSVLELTYGRLELYSTALLPASVATTANSWGLKATGGMLSINHLPGIATPSNGQAIFDGGMLELIDPTLVPVGIPIPAAIQSSANYGFGAISSYAGTSSVLNLLPNAFFRVTGGQRGEWMGTLTVQGVPNSVVKLASNAAGESTRGTGTLILSGGNVQFTPSGPNRILPGDAAFSLELNNNVLFSGGPAAACQLNGNLRFNTLAGSPQAMIDGAVVSNAPTVAAATWLISGTGETNWNGLVVKARTEAVPGAGGPYTTGTVTFNRSKGAPVVVQTGAILRIDYGSVDAGGTGDPFLDSSAAGTRLNIENNSAGPAVGVPPTLGFNIRQDLKSVGSLTVTGFDPTAPNLGTSAAAVFSGGTLSAYHIRQSRLDINAGGVVVIPTNGSTARTSRVNTLTIAAGGQMNLNDNDLMIDYSGVSPIVTVRGYLSAGQLISSTAIASVSPKFAIGYRDNFGLASFSGQTVDASTLLIAYCLAGDADLNGKVNTIDFNYLAGSFGGSGLYWINGDFNYDATTTSTDFNLLVGNFGGSFAVGAAPTLGAPVPEPTGLVAAATMLLLIRRTRNR